MEDLQSYRADHSGSEAEPAAERPFGLIDIVEAFTAMRHEWRTNTKETRQLAELLSVAARHVETTAQQASSAAATSKAAANGEAQRAARDLAITVAEIDHALDRALTASRRVILATDSLALTICREVESAFQKKSWFSRWRRRAWHAEVMRIIDEQPADQIVEGIVGGLDLLQTRVRRLMSDSGIQRIEVDGGEFDGDCMNAIDSVADADVPGGHVAEQLKPVYTWQGQPIVCAEVRVAR